MRGEVAAGIRDLLTNYRQDREARETQGSEQPRHCGHTGCHDGVASSICNQGARGYAVIIRDFLTRKLPK